MMTPPEIQPQALHDIVGDVTGSTVQSKPVIAFLSPFHPYRGGIAQFADCLAAALATRAEVKAFNYSRQYPDFLFPGKTQYAAGCNPKSGSGRVLDSINPLTWFSTVRAIRGCRPDAVLISHWMSLFAPACGVIAGLLRRRGIRVIVLVHNALPHERKFYDRPLTEWFFRKCSGFVCLSDTVADDVRSLRPGASIMLREHPLYDNFGCAEDRLRARRSLGLRPDSKVLLFFGLIRDYKGLDLLIDAMGMLGEGFELLIAGECYGSFDRYRKHIDALPDPASVHHLDGYISDNDVATVFSAADLCVLPYRSATQSGVKATAIHFEVPLVTTPVGSLAASIARDGVGIVADDVSSEALAGAVRQFFEAGAERFTSAIREFKKENTWDNFALEVLESIRRF